MADKPARPTPPTPQPKIDSAQLVEAPPPEETEQELPHTSIFSNPKVSELTGLATSVVLHAIIIMVGVVFAYQPLRDKLLNAVTVEEQNIIPTAELSNADPGGIPNPGMNNDPSRAAAQNVDASVTQSESWAEQKSENLSSTLDSGATGDAAPTVIGTGGGKTGAGSSGMGLSSGGGQLAGFGTPGGGMGIGPKGSVFGNGGNATKIVFVTDGTGTMTGLKMSLVQRELQSTIGKFKPLQEYNVIFFSDGTKASAVDSNKLIAATPPNNRKTFEFLKNFAAVGSTNPIPAIEMAFKMKPQLMYLLSDGEFDNLVSYDDVMKTINELNQDKKVRINTIMFGDRDPRAEAVLKKIAAENGGTQVSVTTDALLKG